MDTTWKGHPIPISLETARDVANQLKPQTEDRLFRELYVVWAELAALRGIDPEVREQHITGQVHLDPAASLVPGPNVPIDPWQHRTEGMRCATCMWFAPKGALGRCRRHAPTLNGYPVVYPTDWCGDHKLNEETVK